MAKSDYLENKILNHVLKNTSYTSPTKVYCALYSTDPGEDDTGTEVAGGSYLRKEITFSTSTAGTTSNTNLIEYDNMPAVTVTHVGICDAETGGNLLYHSALGASKTVEIGNTATIAIGDIDVTED